MNHTQSVSPEPSHQQELPSIVGGHRGEEEVGLRKVEGVQNSSGLLRGHGIEVEEEHLEIHHVGHGRCMMPSLVIAVGHRGEEEVGLRLQSLVQVEAVGLRLQSLVQVEGEEEVGLRLQSLVQVEGVVREPC